MSGMSGLLSVQVSFHVLRPVQDADDFQPVAVIAKIDHMRPAWATSFCQVLRLIPIAAITSATVMS